MYTPASFAETDFAELDALIERDSFVTLIAVHHGMPQVSHLPVLYRRDGEHIELRGHFARPNPQARMAGPALAIVHGPHAYVSPGWYPDKEAQSRVPTWNYAVAHLHGGITLFDDEPSLADIVDSLSRLHEPRVGGDWRYEHGRNDHRVQLRGIVGFCLAVERVQLTFKLNQNHPVGNRRAVADRLDALGQSDASDVARLMRERTLA